MTDAKQIQECPADRLSELLQTAQADDAKGVAAAERLIADYPRDPRLHFLRGSLLASLKRYDEAREAMAAAVKVAPGYAIARFQLGLLELTSGEAETALGTWGPLQVLPADNPLRLFAAGLTHMIRDEWAPAIELLEKGVGLNTEIPPLNRDMQMVIDECRAKLEGRSDDHDGAEQAGEEPASAVEMLLRRYGKETKH